VHWGISDPAAVEGSPSEQRQAFEQAFQILEARIQGLTSLPDDRLENPAALARELRALSGRPKRVC
jgi:hypothetical protein